MKATVYTRCEACAFDLAPPEDREVQPGEKLWNARPPTILVLKECPLGCPKSEYTGNGHPDITVSASCVLCGTDMGVSAKGAAPVACDPDCKTVKELRQAAAAIDSEDEKAAIVLAKASKVQK